MGKVLVYLFAFISIITFNLPSSSIAADNQNADSQDTNTDKSKTHKKQNEFETKIDPIFYLDFDFGLKTTNLTPHNPRKADPSKVSKDYDASRNTLVAGDYENGFRVVNYYRIEGGLGARARFFFENGTGLRDSLFAYVGLLPYLGKDMVNVRYVPTLEDIEGLKQYHQPPEDPLEILSWTTGDNITYAKKGGMIYLSGVGVSIISGHALKISEGLWQVYVEKYSEHEVYIRVSDAHIETTNIIQSTGGILSVGNSQSDRDETKQAFVVDISTKSGQQAYHDIVNGNLAGVQLLSENGELPEVQKAQNTQLEQHSDYTNWFFGIPIFLNTTWGTGETFSMSEHDMFLENAKADVHYGVYSRESRSNFFFRHKSTIEAFYGAQYEVRMDDGSKHPGYFGQYIWTSESDHSSDSKLRISINNLVRKTGLDDLVKVNIPTEKDLGYTSVKFTVTLSQEQTNQLMTMPNKWTKDALVFRTQLAIDTYLALESDPLDLCSIYETSASNDEDYFWSEDPCAAGLQRSTEKGVAEMLAALSAMVDAQKSGSDKDFVNAYAQFGKGLTENAFTFNAGVELAGPGSTVSYLIEGTHLSMYELRLVSDGGDIHAEAPFDLEKILRPSLEDKTKNRGIIFAPANPYLLNPIMPSSGH